jgi:hypothetical protein
VNKTALFIGSHNEEIEASVPMLPQLLVKAAWRVVILNPVGGLNWIDVRRMKSSDRHRLTQSSIEAARVLGCEKVVWDYHTGASLEWKSEMLREMAEFLYKINPTMVFIHWPYDTHFDHQAVAKISLQVLRSCSSLVGDDSFRPEWKEIWAYTAGIVQTYDFLPDAMVLGDEQLMKTAGEAMAKFSYEKNKKDIWAREVANKSKYWSGGNNRPVEPLKFMGPLFPVGGTILKQVIGDKLVSTQPGSWLKLDI